MPIDTDITPSVARPGTYLTPGNAIALNDRNCVGVTDNNLPVAIGIASNGSGDILVYRGTSLRTMFAEDYHCSTHVATIGNFSTFRGLWCGRLGGSLHVIVVGIQSADGRYVQRLWKDTSGDGTTWTFVGDVQNIGHASGSTVSELDSCGEIWEFPSGRWVKYGMRYFAPGFGLGTSTHAAIYTSDDNGASWTLRWEKGYYLLGGVYTDGAGRSAAYFQGKMYYNSWGNVDADTSVWSSDELASTTNWSQPTENAEWILSDGTFIYRLNRDYKLERTSGFPEVNPAYTEVYDLSTIDAHWSPNNVSVSATVVLVDQVSGQKYPALVRGNKILSLGNLGGWVVGAVTL